MTNDKKTTWQDLRDELKRNLEQAVEDGDIDNFDDDNTGVQDDLVRELVDSCVPTDSFILLEVAMDNLNLATVEPEIYCFGGEHTAINAIAGTIYEELLNEAYEWIRERGETMRKVKCNACGEWQGNESELVLKDDIEHCPKCGASHGLMDI